MPWELARAAHSAHLAVLALTCCPDLAPHNVVADVARVLSESRTTEHKEATFEGVAFALSSHWCAVSEPRVAARTIVDSVWELSEESVLGSVMANDSVNVLEAQAHPLEQLIEALSRRDIDGEQLAHAIINRESLKHIGLIRTEAAKLQATLPDGQMGDLITWGWIGLRRALRVFDVRRGYAFSTYACPKINSRIRDGIRDEDYLPKRLTTVRNAAKAAEAALAEDLRRRPTFEEIAGKLKHGEKFIDMLPRMVPSASLDEMALWDGGEAREPSCLIDREDPSDSAATNIIRSQVRAAVSELPAPEALAIDLLFLRGMTLPVASSHSGVSTSELRAAKRRGLAALHPRLSNLAEVA